jgi:hypothetical protein
MKRIRLEAVQEPSEPPETVADERDETETESRGRRGLAAVGGM